MTVKYRWKISPPPTGRYRSFETHEWPHAEYVDPRLQGLPCAFIVCDDAYQASRAKSGQHGPLTLKIYDHSGGPGRRKTLKVKTPFKTIDECKQKLAELMAQFGESWSPRLEEVTGG